MYFYEFFSANLFTLLKNTLVDRLLSEYVNIVYEYKIGCTVITDV